MFKTSEECSLELVAHSVRADAVDNYSPTETHAGQDLDFMPCSAARVSFGNEDKTGNDTEKDRKLMKYLADHQHMTPFEYQHATFLVECPLFIRSQIHRHRTFSFNEISRRYTAEDLEFWVPSKARKQSSNNRQASTEEEVTTLVPFASFEDPYGSTVIPAISAFKYSAWAGLNYYNLLLNSGVCREQARAVLPQSLLTKFYMGGNLRNWAHFVELRRDEHAQPEVQVVANRIAEKLRELWPESCTALGI